MEKEIESVITSGFVGGLLALIVKIIWDWLLRGRSEKGVYMLIAECDKRQIACGLPTFRREFQENTSHNNEHQVMTTTRLKEIEKQLDQGHNDFVRIMGDISQIKQTLASMPTDVSFSSVKTDISKIFESIARIQTVVEYSYKTIRDQT